MKRMIISPAQLKAINEVAVTTYANSPSAADVLTAVQGVAGKTSANNIKVGVPNNPGGLEVSTTFKELQNGANLGTNTGSVNVTMNPADTENTGISESRYSKRQVELGRMLEMRKNGKVFSKKQLNEMFMETQENADRLRAGIGNCKLFDIFKAVEEVFPEELDNFKSAFSEGADIVEYLCNVFSRNGVDDGKEDEFLNKLGI